MKVTTSYGVRITSRKLVPLIRKTIQIYRDALEYMIPFVHEHWDTIGLIANSDQRFNYAESLLHTTKSHQAVCDFDQKFPVMPSFFRRACLKEAIGAVQSYLSNHENWVEGGRIGGEPKLTARRHACPTFYKTDMYKPAEGGRPAQIKLYSGTAWIWVDVPLRRQDLKYIGKYCAQAKKSAPTMEKKNRYYYLRFTFTENVKLPKKAVKDQKICAFDLGINKDAVCCIMDAHGTVLARKFLDFASEKDLLYRVLNRIKKLQRQYGSGSGIVKNAWAYAKRLNDMLSRHIADAVFKFALENGVDCIVMEALSMSGKLHGSKKQRLAVWKKQAIQKMICLRAHRAGTRWSRVCAWSTSALAFDGSGRVIRGRRNLTKREIAKIVPILGTKTPLPKDGRDGTYTNMETCTFQNGKEYNCDLNASYNIGARYFIRGLLDEVPEEERAEIEKLIPDAAKATSRTLNTLKSLWDFYKKPMQAEAAGA